MSNRIYDVIILGAGWSGLLACKYSLAEGLETLVLEGRDKIGGVWAYTDDRRYGGVMKTTSTTSSRCITEISDFPMPPDYPDFPTHAQIHAYLLNYCVHFALLDHIKLNQDVVRVSKSGNEWQVLTSEGAQFRARNLLVSSGVHQHPNDLSSDRRFRGYTGTILHSAAVKEVSKEFAGKTVIIWGGGESASDIAVETGNLARATYFCIPNGQWFVPKIVDRWPPFPSSQRKVVDHTSSRLRLRLSPTHQYSPFINQYLQFAFGFNGHGQEAWRTAAPYNRSFFNKSGTPVLAHVRSGRVIPRRDIERCDGRTVHFTDGTATDADFVVMCSGYRARFPFFDDPTFADGDPRKWFKHVFYNPDPTLAFVGFVRPIFGSIPGISELQSRLVASVFSGKIPLPDAAERDRTIAKDAAFWNHHFRFTSLRLAGLVDHFLYSDQMARLIGCRPKFSRLFFSNPLRWWQAITAPWNGCQFWLDDPSHRERVFATFRRYDDNRISQIYTFLLLAPLLPLIGLATHLRVILYERFTRRPNRDLTYDSVTDRC